MLDVLEILGVQQLEVAEVVPFDGVAGVEESLAFQLDSFAIQ